MTRIPTIALATSNDHEAEPAANLMMQLLSTVTPLIPGLVADWRGKKADDHAPETSSTALGMAHLASSSNEKPEFDFFTFVEAKRLVAAADGEWQTMIIVALPTGMRIGELLALQWQDVDLVAGRITVRRNVVLGPPRHAQIGQVVRDPVVQTTPSRR